MKGEKKKKGPDGDGAANPNTRDACGTRRLEACATVELPERTCFTKKHMEEFRLYVVDHCLKAAGEIRAEVNANVVWSQLIAAFKSGVFGKTPEDLGRWFKAVKSPSDVGHPPDAPNQVDPPWVSYRLYFDPDVFETLKAHLAKARESMPLSRNDIRDQFAANGYFVPHSKARPHKQRLVGRESPTTVWCIAIDLHPMGYEPVTDEEFQQSLLELKESGLMRDQWNDPRKGELFLIIHALERKVVPGPDGSRPVGAAEDDEATRRYYDRGEK